MNRIAAACCRPSRVAAAAVSSLRASAETHRADRFRKTPIAMGSDVDWSDVHSYPFVIGKSDNKPIRVFLQDAENDLDNQFGKRPLADKPMAKALEFRDDRDKLVVGSRAKLSMSATNRPGRLAACPYSRICQLNGEPHCQLNGEPLDVTPPTVRVARPLTRHSSLKSTSRLRDMAHKPSLALDLTVSNVPFR